MLTLEIVCLDLRLCLRQWPVTEPLRVLAHPPLLHLPGMGQPVRDGLRQRLRLRQRLPTEPPMRCPESHASEQDVVLGQHSLGDWCVLDSYRRPGIRWSRR